jgi:hypothetical protein
MPKGEEAFVRFLNLVDTQTDSGCWEWLGSRLPTGYGRFRDGGRLWPSHRWIYVDRYGPIDEELHVHHLCRNRGCVRPDHLEAMTKRENDAFRLHTWTPLQHESSRLRFELRTHCPHGHPYDEDNTYWQRRKDGSKVRVCRACKRIKGRDFMRRKRAEQNGPEGPPLF